MSVSAGARNAAKSLAKVCFSVRARRCFFVCRVVRSWVIGSSWWASGKVGWSGNARRASVCSSSVSWSASINSLRAVVTACSYSVWSSRCNNESTPAPSSTSDSKSLPSTVTSRCSIASRSCSVPTRSACRTAVSSASSAAVSRSSCSSPAGVPSSSNRLRWRSSCVSSQGGSMSAWRWTAIAVSSRSRFVANHASVRSGTISVGVSSASGRTRTSPSISTPANDSSRAITVAYPRAKSASSRVFATVSIDSSGNSSRARAYCSASVVTTHRSRTRRSAGASGSVSPANVSRTDSVTDRLSARFTVSWTALMRSRFRLG